MNTKIVQRAFGGPDVLEVAEAEAPTRAELGDHEALVRVTFAGVNPIDVMTRAGGGMAAAGLVNLPLTPGWDLSGSVEAVGGKVADLTPGQRVLGMVRFPRAGAAYAQYAIVPAADVVPTPPTLSDQDAAALPMAAMTAWQAFTDTTTLQPGQRVLITGAGGGVGHLAVQLAHHLGATVVAVASTGKHAWLRELGADVTLDYTDATAVAALANDPVDLAFSLAADSADAALAAIRPGGMLIALGTGADAIGPAAEAAGVRFAATHVRTNRDWLGHVVALASDGTLTPTVTQVFDLTAAADAHRAIEAGHTRGKILLRA